MLAIEALIVIFGWLTSLCVAIFLVPRIAARRVCRNFGLDLVTQGGKEFYVACDPSGDPIKIPIGTKDVNGTPEVIYGYAPLAYSLPIIAAEYSAQRLMASLRGAKADVSKKLSKEALASGLGDEIVAFLPKKLQGVYAIGKALGWIPGSGSQGGPFLAQTGQQTGSSGFRPGL